VIYNPGCEEANLKRTTIFDPEDPYDWQAERLMEQYFP
jgi:hypothetical protein